MGDLAVLWKLAVPGSFQPWLEIVGHPVRALVSDVPEWLRFHHRLYRHVAMNHIVGWVTLDTNQMKAFDISNDEGSPVPLNVDPDLYKSFVQKCTK